MAAKGKNYSPTPGFGSSKGDDDYMDVFPPAQVTKTRADWMNDTVRRMKDNMESLTNEMQMQVDVIRDEMRSERDIYNQRLELLNQARSINILNADEFNTMSEHVNNVFNGMVEASQRSARLIESGISGALESIANNDLNNFVNSWIRSFDKIFFDLAGRNIINLLEPTMLGAGRVPKLRIRRRESRRRAGYGRRVLSSR